MRPRNQGTIFKLAYADEVSSTGTNMQLKIEMHKGNCGSPMRRKKKKFQFENVFLHIVIRTHSKDGISPRLQEEFLKLETRKITVLKYFLRRNLSVY